MFRKNKQENKAKLEYKLYLARESPEPVFDLSGCNIDTVPHGIYSLCRVFLKQSLLLQQNSLTSLSGGGKLIDLGLIEVLNISENSFSKLPEDINLLQSLKELYANSNNLTKLPPSLCKLSKLRILDVSNNKLKSLPENFGELTSLKKLSINDNSNLKTLPKSICQAQSLAVIKLDAYNFDYPPQEVVSAGCLAIMKFIANDTGFEYAPNSESEQASSDDVLDGNDETDTLQAKIWELEQIKMQKMREFLDIERKNELRQRKELELATSQKLQREKLLADITEQQNRFDEELVKVHKEKEFERFRLIEQLQEAENNADIAIKQLLSINREPLLQLLEQEKLDEERLFNTASEYVSLRRGSILSAMEKLLQDETRHFEQYNQNRIETSRNVLETEIESDMKLAEILRCNDLHKAELLSQLQQDSELQKAAVGTLLERGDARSWGLLQQVRLVEAQLAALTNIELDRRKLEVERNLNDLSEKRVNLSILLVDLLEQQRQRRSELIQTLQALEEYNDSVEDFWLRQYQRLLEKLPEGLLEAQKHIDPVLGQALLVNGVIHCLPFLAKFSQCQLDTETLTDDDLKEAGVLNYVDRIHILDAFRVYHKEKLMEGDHYKPSAPLLPVEEASAPLPDTVHTSNTTECVICLDLECQIIFFPCGHLCCCSECSTSISECPMCRSSIERKIKIIVS